MPETDNTSVVFSTNLQCGVRPRTVTELERPVWRNTMSESKTLVSVPLGEMGADTPTRNSL